MASFIMKHKASGKIMTATKKNNAGTAVPGVPPSAAIPAFKT